MGVLILGACSQEKKLLRKAAVSVEQSDFENAVVSYDQILKKDKDSYFGNAGKGVVLSEYMGKHEQAIPYLEKALEKSPKKTQTKLNTDLGRSYHFIGNYSRALYFYSQALPLNNEDNPDYDAFLSKRIADCKYAMEHTEVSPAEEQWVKNMGKPINSEMPEYSPVMVNGDMIFTSQRKDGPKEKKNGVDGKYFENMYISKTKDGAFTQPERFTLPDYSKNGKFNKHNESVISASADQKTLFIYRDGKIFETKLSDTIKAANKLSNAVNFGTLQNHAFLSADSKTIFFTSESDKGIGGTDIYTAVKSEDGEWSPPQLMGFNTLYNEDTPYMNESGTLFFSSNGLPGYGGYDVYSTRMENGKWTTPENVGQPINTPGDDLYFTLTPNSPNGYYASSRTGGLGDMDIYQVHYVFSKVRDCKENSQQLMTVNATPSGSNNLAYDVALELPEGYSKKVRSYTWTINNTPVMQTTSSFDHKFETAGTYTVAAKVIVYCDTCPSLISLCNEKVITVGDVLAKKDTTNSANSDLAAGTDKKGSKNNKKGKGNKDNKNVSDKGTEKDNTATDDLSKNDKTKNEKLTDEKSTTDKDAADVNKNTTKASKSGSAFLSEDELKTLNWNNGAVYFDYNQSSLRNDILSILDNNIDVLKNNSNLYVSIDGFADSRGTEAYNISLSAKRVQAVKQYLTEKGVSANRIISTHSLGEKKLVNNCTDGTECSEEQHQANRRVEFKVKSK